MIGGGRPTPEILGQDLQTIFALSDSAVAPSKKIN